MVWRIMDQHFVQIMLFLFRSVGEHAGWVGWLQFLRLIRRIDFRLNLLADVVEQLRTTVVVSTPTEYANWAAVMNDTS